MVIKFVKKWTVNDQRKTSKKTLKLKGQAGKGYRENIF
jgi:hypothetical protein